MKFIRPIRPLFLCGDYSKFPPGFTPKQLSKEFVREWLMENGFSGQLDRKCLYLQIGIDNISKGILIYENIMGTAFEATPYDDAFYEDMEACICNMLARL
jgi:phosphoribosylaminoimidazole-succinocarboxamide synthase